MSARGEGIEALSTRGLGGAKRLEFWNDVVCKTFTSLTVDVPNEQIDARMRCQNAGELRFAIADSTSATLRSITVCPFTLITSRSPPVRPMTAAFTSSLRAISMI